MEYLKERRKNRADTSSTTKREGDALLRRWSLMSSNISCVRQNFGNLRRINRRRDAAIDDLQFSASGVVRNRCYLGLDNFAAVEADPDAGAYAIIHSVSILAPLSIDGTLPARRPLPLMAVKKLAEALQEVVRYKLSLG